MCISLDQNQRRGILRRIFLGIAGVGGLLLGASALSGFHGLSFVVRAAGLQGVVRFVAHVDTVRYTERLVRVPLQVDSLETRIYAPLQRSRQTVLLLSGLHTRLTASGDDRGSAAEADPIIPTRPASEPCVVCVCVRWS